MTKEILEVSDRITKKLADARRRIVRGWVPRRDFIVDGKRAAAATWIRKQRKLMTIARRDEDEIMFEKAVASWEKAFEKLNRICGEAYRAKYPDPEEWPLRYFRWMRIKYMELECDLGTFYLVPRMSSRKPRVDHWMTADEMIDILETPALVAAIKTFGLPSRGGEVDPPKKGEKHMYINLTGDGKEVCHYDYPGAVKRV
jgi:hypothetical protein